MLEEEKIEEYKDGVSHDLQVELARREDIRTQNPEWLAGVLYGLKLVTEDVEMVEEEEDGEFLEGSND